MKIPFTEVEIIDLPFFPFTHDSGLERNITDHISKSIIRIRNNKLRIGEMEKPTKRQYFDISNTLIGVDISSLVDREVSYLETLQYVINLFPLICINNNINKTRLKSIHLHNLLKEKFYILPFLPRLNPADNLYTKKRYGDSLIQLLKGKLEKVALSDLNNMNLYYDIRDLLNRFSNLIVEGTALKYKIELTLLGVDDELIENFINYIFNGNIEQFNIDKACADFDINKQIFFKYLKNSMLFEIGNNENVKFRFTKKNIVFKIKTALLQRFENKLYDYSAIDSSETNFAKFTGTFLEYHELGKIFNKNDSFCIKLITLIKSSYNHENIDRIVIVDNGNENIFKTLLEEIFQKPVSRLINNGGFPNYYPFDKINFKERILIITDICNTGEFINSVVNFLVTNNNARIIGVFSLIINCDFNSLQINSKNLIHQEFKFLYYVEKVLHNVKDIMIKKQAERIYKIPDERFLFFWNTVDKIGGVKKKLYCSGNRMGVMEPGLTKVKSTFTHAIHLDEHADNIIAPSSDFYFFVTNLLDQHSITDCILNRTASAKVFSKILSKIRPTVRQLICSFENPIDSVKEFYSKNKNVLFYDDGINLGLNASNLFNFIGEEEIISNNNVIFLALFSRINVKIEAQLIHKEYREKINKITNNRFYVYYDSCLPYYLLLTDNFESNQEFEKKLMDCLEINYATN